MIEAVVFDFDGTLVDSNQIKRDAYYAAFEAVPGARKCIAQALKTYPDKDRYFIIRTVVENLRRSGRITRSEGERMRARAVRRYSAYCRTKIRDARDFAGVAATLRALSRKYRLAINSATPQRHLRQLVSVRRWAHYCKVIVGAPSTKVANLRRIARRFSLGPREIMFVGDSRIDATAAAHFGCAFAHARNLKNLPRLIMHRNARELNV